MIIDFRTYIRVIDRLVESEIHVEHSVDINLTVYIHIYTLSFIFVFDYFDFGFFKTLNIYTRRAFNFYQYMYVICLYKCFSSISEK